MYGDKLFKRRTIMQKKGIILMAKKKTAGFAPVKNMEDMKKDFKQTYIIEAIVLGIGCMYLFLSVYGADVGGYWR